MGEIAHDDKIISDFTVLFCQNLKSAEVRCDLLAVSGQCASCLAVVLFHIAVHKVCARP